MASGEIHHYHPEMLTENLLLVEQQSFSVRRPYDGRIEWIVHPFVLFIKDRSCTGSVGVDNHALYGPSIGNPVALGRPGRIASLSNRLHCTGGDVDHYNLLGNQSAARSLDSPRQEISVRRPTKLCNPKY